MKTKTSNSPKMRHHTAFYEYRKPGGQPMLATCTLFSSDCVDKLAMYKRIMFLQFGHGYRRMHDVRLHLIRLWEDTDIISSQRVDQRAIRAYHIDEALHGCL